MTGVGSVEGAISRVLRTGVVVSMVLMTAGLADAMVRGPLTDTGEGALDRVIDSSVVYPHTPAEVWRSLAEGRAAGLVTVGLLVLVLTPLVRVGASVMAYARAGDRTYLAFTLVVVALLGLSMVVGGG